MEKESKHQTLMNESYQLWTDEKGFTYENFLLEVEENLSENHLNAVITGNLNYQVENGGFRQWYDNGYYASIDRLVEFFTKNFKDNEIIKKIIYILEDVHEDIEWAERGKLACKRCNYELYEYKEFFIESFEDKLCDLLEKYDNRYYGISEDLMKILEDFFTTEKLGETTSSASPESQSVITS